MLYLNIFLVTNNLKINQRLFLLKNLKFAIYHQCFINTTQFHMQTVSMKITGKKLKVTFFFLLWWPLIDLHDRSAFYQLFSCFLSQRILYIYYFFLIWFFLIYLCRYISCNPESLVANAIELCTPSVDKTEKGNKNNRGWRNMSSAGLARHRAKSMPNSEPFQPIKAMAVDLFPHTPHCELVMLLER